MNNESSANSFCFFGKLPQYPDFIRYKSSSEEFIIFDNWLQRGIATAKQDLGSSWKDIYSNSQNVDFFFPVKNSEYILSGTFHPSSDRSGRQFPFVVFSELPKSFFNPNQAGTFPLILNSVFYRAKQLHSVASKTSEINDIVNEFNKTEVRLNSASAAENILNEYLENTTLNDFLSRTKIETSLSERVELSDSGSIALRFISDDENNNFDTGFAIYFSFVLYNRSNSMPYFFKTSKSDEKVELFIYFNHPDAAEFTKLISGGRSTDKIISSLLNNNNPHISLKDFIDENRLH